MHVKGICLVPLGKELQKWFLPMVVKVGLTKKVKKMMRPFHSEMASQLYSLSLPKTPAWGV